MEAAGISNDTLKLIISNDPVKLMVFAGTSKFDFLIESAAGWVVSVFNYFTRSSGGST